MTAQLSNEQIQKAAPSVFAGQPYEGQSQRYAFVSTLSIIDQLREAGFVPVFANQTISRIPGKQNFTKHVIRFRHINDLNFEEKSVGDYIVEAIVTNSHDGSSAYDLGAGVHVIRCKNGLVAPEGLISSVRVRHVGNVFERIVEGVTSILDKAPIIGETIGRWKAIRLSEPERLALAKSAFELRFDEDSNLYSAIRPDQLLTPKRYGESSNNLWDTFNVVQENVIRGGLRGETNDGKRVKTRSVRGIDQDNRLNKALWVLGEEMARLHE